MARWIAFPALVLLASITAACATVNDSGGGTPPTGPATNTQPSTTPPSPTDATPAGATARPVSITRTGGFAGVNERVEIAADGSWVYTDARQNRTERGELTVAQRLALARLITDPRFAQEIRAKAGPGVCNDAFQYTIKAGEFSGSFEDCGGTDRPVVQAVIKAITDATAL